MRRRSVLLAVPAGLLTLAGCGDDSSGSHKTSHSTKPSTPTPSPTPKATIVSGPVPDVTAGTKFGQKPTVAKGSGKPSSDLAVKTLVQGHGTTVAKGDFLRVNYLGQVWKTGKVFDESYGKRKPVVFQVGSGQIIQGWEQGLPGKKAGSRVELAIPPKFGYGKQGQPKAGIKGTDTLVFVVDIVDVFNAKSSAKGTKVAQHDTSLPTVGTNTDGKAPAIHLPSGAPPKKLVSQYVLEGDGPTVGAQDTVLVQYKGVLWHGGKQFDATYSHGQLAQFSLQQVIKGWSEAMTGKKVGSRLLIVIPPSLGYGKKGSQGIPGNSTLVFSVDILAVG